MTVFEWDAEKARGNLEKHGIDFADVFAVFEDEHALTIEDPDDREHRFLTLGMDCFGRILAVVYTWRGTAIRIISARKATKSECRQYEG